VTRDAEEKTRFVLVDAVGVTESLKHVSQPLDRDRAIGFDRLVDDIAAGRRADDAISTLAARLAALDRKIDDKARAEITKAAGGLDPKAWRTACSMRSTLIPSSARPTPARSRPKRPPRRSRTRRAGPLTIPICAGC
jgi:type I restriction enzyme R subunit